MNARERQESKMYKTIIYGLLLMTLLVSIAQAVQAQDQSSTTDIKINQRSTYHTAIGIRGGEMSGLTFKQFLNGSNAIEVIAWGNRNSLGVTGLYEWYQPAFDVAGLNWYYGVGAHGRFRDDNLYWNEKNRGYNEGIALGIDGIVGIEYKIQPIPFAVSLDVKPFVETWTTGDIGLGIDPGLGIKFVF